MHTLGLRFSGEFVLALASMVLVAFADERPTSTIEGTVVDEAGRPVPAATVRINAVRLSVVGSDGNFENSNGSQRTPLADFD